MSKHGELIAAISRVVAYNWSDEEADYSNEALEPGNSREGHVFGDLMLIQHWLENEHGYPHVEPRIEDAGPAQADTDPGPLIPGEDSDWRDGNDDEPFNWDAAALLPTGELMNPARPEDARYYDRSQVAYVVTDVISGLVRVLTSFGALNGWDLGSEHAIRHDQSCLPLGTWRVTGIRDYSAGALIAPLGEIPDRPLRHWVFKL